ncbi:hypothetical protein ABPG74_006797, partial [Tetrahymena malaccensis]
DDYFLRYRFSTLQQTQYSAQNLNTFQLLKPYNLYQQKVISNFDLIFKCLLKFIKAEDKK